MAIGEAAEGTTHPLIELVPATAGDTEPTLSPDETYGARIETTSVQFVVSSLSRNPLEAWTIAAQVKLLYDGQYMSLGATQNIVDVKRDDPGNEVRDYNNDSWNILITYTYKYG